MQGMMAVREEKILVLVRLRPLNEKEIDKSEVADWECINHSTILYRNSLQERSGLPTAYTFDRVFSGDCSTKQVYEEGTKEIALSVVSGINSSVFAYGQTSSGKTYTMNGITEHTLADIYDYMQKHEERAFAVKFSAMEIYNENVRDLLTNDNTPLRLLDDPEKGTIVEKMTEEILKDWNHLKKLLSICEAQRKIGETSLNETSSRSHQILKITIESSAREFLDKEKSSTLSASVFFIDLAGSERASQALSAGARLKEGCHINRSLLTLGNVIRKLSNGRQGHINYRDSKLTRILQPCLGGNARTSIICTLSPARSHVEQSRNTLLFASCAKEVSTNAKVNVVMSDKALVKHLRKELARLENELKSPAPTSSSCNCATVIKKKDLQIEKMEKEIRELRKQRDLAQSRVADLMQLIGDDQKSSQLKGHGQRSKWATSLDRLGDECSTSDFSEIDHHFQNGGLAKFSREETETYNGEESEEQCKEVQCIEMEEVSSQLQSTANENEHLVSRNISGNRHGGEGFNRRNVLQNGLPNGTLQQRSDEQRTNDYLADHYPAEYSPSSSRSQFRDSKGNLVDNTPPDENKADFPGKPESLRKTFLPLDYSANSAKMSRNNSRSSIGTNFVDDTRSQSGNDIIDDEIPTIGTFVAGLKDAKRQYEKQLRDCQVWDSVAEVEMGKNKFKEVLLETVPVSMGTPLAWSEQYESLQRSIIGLWHACNVSLVHRTYFFLLFRGDPSDSIYLEVELRRLSFLKDTFSQGLNRNVIDGQTQTLASSTRSLRREREALSKLVNKRFSEAEKQKLYKNWEISLDSKRRRWQLVSRLWTDTEDKSHIRESASIVAKLVKFSVQGQALKEMFGLSFVHHNTTTRRSSFGWKTKRFSA